MYSQINKTTNQMLTNPAPLPQRWSTADGSTINDFHLLPQEALFALGWVPVTYAEIGDTQTHEHAKTPTFNEVSKQFEYLAQPKNLDLLKSESVDTIARMIDKIVAPLISNNVGQEMRYLQKLCQAQDFKTAHAAGLSPDPTLYPYILLESQKEGDTPIQRAEHILSVAGTIMNISASIEAIKVHAQRKIREATTHEQVILARDEAITSLQEVT